MIFIKDEERSDFIALHHVTKISEDVTKTNPKIYKIIFHFGKTTETFSFTTAKEKKLFILGTEELIRSQMTGYFKFDKSLENFKRYFNELE